MGFRFKKVLFTLGSDAFPYGKDDAAKSLIRAQTIVRSIAQALIDMGIGWGLDSRHSGITDYKSIPDYYYGDRNTALFLVNAVSGCKLFLGCVVGKGNKGINVSDDFIVKTYNSSYTSSAGCVAGVIMSIIPAGSQSVFGTTASNLIPSDATRITGTIVTNSNPSYINDTFVYNNSANGTVFGYGVCATKDVVGIIWRGTSDGIMWPRCFCGKILGTLAHKSDNTIQSKYGTITFKCSPGGSGGCSEEGWAYQNATSGETTYNISSNNTTPAYGSINSQFNAASNYSVSGSNYICGGNSVCNESGSWVSNTENTGVCMRMDNFMILSDMIHSFSGSNIRWSSLIMAILSTDPAAYGVVAGDGIKGILDTDLFRIANCSYGQLYNNGKFIGFNERCLLGWSPNNESL